MVVELKSTGWDWRAFILGPFWYLSKGMNSKGLWLLILLLITCLLAAPFVWVYCGAKGRGDFYNFRLKARSRIDLNQI